jgi:hypothetical protein
MFPAQPQFYYSGLAYNQLGQFKKQKKKCWKWDWLSGRRQGIRNKLQHTTWWSVSWFRRRKEKRFLFFQSQLIIKIIKLKWINFSITSSLSYYFRASRKRLWQSHRSGHHI